MLIFNLVCFIKQITQMKYIEEYTNSYSSNNINSNNNSNNNNNIDVKATLRPKIHEMLI